MSGIEQQVVSGAEEVIPARLQMGEQIGAAGRSTIARQDFFKHNWERELAGFQGELLILGNLPWVTNAAISSLDGANVPVKHNFHGFRGLGRGQTIVLRNLRLRR